jgi:DNA-binding CsgD family transcriptional regulator
MACLGNREQRTALDILHAIGAACVNGRDFARRGIFERPRPAASGSCRSDCSLDEGSPKAAPKHRDPPLTRREREVLDWVGAGKCNRDIAAILGASPRTVEKHLEHIYIKLGVETRTAAAIRGMQRGRHG